MALLDALFQQLSTVADAGMPVPGNIASAATISPNTFLTFLSGTAQLQTINPPIPGAHLLCFVFTNAAPGVFLTTGNIKVATAPVQNVPVYLVWDPITQLYWSGRSVT